MGNDPPRGWFRHDAVQCANIPRGPAAELLFLLKKPQDKDALLLKTTYTRGVTLSSLGQLIAAGIVKSNRQGIFSISSRFKLPEFQLYFFELKLSKWQRALAQAIQAKMYANKTFCVFPAAAEKTILKQRSVFRRMEIGVLLFDPLRMQLYEPIRARQTISNREAYKIDVLLRLASLESNKVDHGKTHGEKPATGTRLLRVLFRPFSLVWSKTRAHFS